jgi:hypothetical protein
VILTSRKQVHGEGAIITYCDISCLSQLTQLRCRPQDLHLKQALYFEFEQQGQHALQFIVSLLFSQLLLICGAEELTDEMSLKQIYLLNWSPRVK